MNWFDDVTKFHEMFPEVKFGINFAMSASSGWSGRGPISYDGIKELVGESDGIFSATQLYHQYDVFPFASVYPIPTR